MSRFFPCRVPASRNDKSRHKGCGSTRVKRVHGVGLHSLFSPAFHPSSSCPIHHTIIILSRLPCILTPSFPSTSTASPNTLPNPQPPSSPHTHVCAPRATFRVCIGFASPIPSFSFASSPPFVCSTSPGPSVTLCPALHFFVHHYRTPSPPNLIHYLLVVFHYPFQACPPSASPCLHPPESFSLFSFQNRHAVLLAETE
jgi:hypothetical protein